MIARNSRGDGPAVTETVAPFERPSQVTGLQLVAGDRSLQASWERGQLAGQCDRELRLPGRRRGVGQRRKHDLGNDSGPHREPALRGAGAGV